jgi:hypothetical protein
VRDRRRLMAMVGDAFPGVPHAQRERWRYALAALTTRDREQGPVVSFQALTDGERAGLAALLTDVRAGRLLVAEDGTGAIVASTAKRNAIMRPPATEGGQWTVQTEDRG